MRFVETVDKINGLPLGFKEVEYLESTGEQYIDTGVYVNNTLKTDIHFEVVDRTQGGHIFGGRTVTSGGRGYGVYLPTSGGIGFDYETRLTSNVSTTDGYKYRVIKDGASNTLYVNGVQSYTGNNTAATFDLNVKIALFYMKDSNTTFNDSVKCKVFYFKIWDNGVLVRDFIPCLDNNGKPCMYDLVGKKPYYNQGTGADFSYGRQIIPVEYLESTGTQYINMGIKSSANMFVKAKFNVSNASAKAVFGSYSGSSTDGVGVFFGTAGGNIPGKVYCNNTNVAVSPDLTLSTNTNYEIEMSGTTLVINGSTYTSAATASNSYDMLLFARSNNGTVERQISGKIYNLKIWDNGTLVRDYIPAIDENNTPFMFDKVTHTAYLNAGTGEFLYGNPVASNKGKIRFPVTQHEKSRLPLGFREVEYLQSTGTQYIDTGVYPTQLTEAEYGCAITGSVSNVDSHLFGSRLSASSEAFDLAYMNTSPNGTEKFRFIHGTTTTQETTTSVTASQLASPHTYYMSGTSFKVDGVEKMSFTTASFTGTYSLWLFGVNSAGSLHNQVRAQRVYKCKLWDNGVLVRDMIPCLDVAGKPCMYDLVGKKPYYNQGTGADFNYGREIHYVEYLESTGTQYIDTGLKGKNGYDFDYKVNFTQLGGSLTNAVGGEWENNKACYFGMVRTTEKFAYHYQGTSTAIEIQTMDIDTDYRIQAHLYSGEQYYIINGTKSAVGTITGTFTSTYNMRLFSVYSSSPLYSHLKMYFCKVWDDDILVRDYIPAIDENNVPFMFDRVTHTAFLNAGTGTFLYGNLLKQSKIRIVLPPPIPLIYKPVEYLESTGEQYIDTGLLSTAQSKVDLTFSFTSMESGVANNVGIFGGRNAQQSTTFTLFKIASGNPQYFRFDYNGQTTVATASQMTWDTTSKYRFEYDGTKYTTTNTTTSQSNTAILNPSSTFTTSPICLFAVNTSETIGQYLSGRIYKYWYTDGTNTIDLIPVIRRSDKKPGFYCKVTKQFFTNAGTGEFLYG